MGIWEWVTAGLAIWGAVSILVAIAWGLVGRKIFRKPPQPPTQSGVVFTGDFETDRRQLDRHRGGER